MRERTPCAVARLTAGMARSHPRQRKVNVGTVMIDNNCCERAVRPFTNLRKSFGGFSSEKGARTAATILTFVETCKLKKKNVLDFFKGFFDMVVCGRTDYEQMTQALLCVNEK